MGRHQWSIRPTVEDSHVLDICKLRELGYLEGQKHWQAVLWKNIRGEIIRHVFIRVNIDPLGQDSYIHLRYIPPSLAEKKEYFGTRVRLVHTKPHFGGQRVWFSCPGLQSFDPCWKRVAKLYRPPYEDHFACRTCWDLTYESQKSHNKNFGALF
jgi:hypothetical protein